MSDRQAASLSRIATVIVAGVVVATFLVAVLPFLVHVNDDAYITFRYARLLASGEGPYFNPGEHVEGYSNFSWMVLMAAVFAVAGEAAVPVAAKTLGVAAAAGALVVSVLLARALARSLPRSREAATLCGAIGAWLVAVFPGYAVNSTTGLETAPFGLLVTLASFLGILAIDRGRWRGAGLAWAAAILTRPEGVALAGVWWLASLAATLGRRRRPPAAGTSAIGPLVADAAILAAVVAAQLALRWMFYDGELLPNTFWAKADGFFGHRPWDYVRNGATAPFFGVGVVILALLGWFRGGETSRRAVPSIAVAIAGAALPFVVGTDWMPGWRFSVPFLPLLGVVVGLGAFRVIDRGVAVRFRWAVVAAIGLVAVAIVVNGAEREALRKEIALRATGYETGHVALADWIRGFAARPGDTVALMDIGIVGYYCPEQRILDVTGLTDRFIAKSPGAFLAKDYDPSYVLDQRPEIIVLVLSALGDPAVEIPPGARIGTWVKNEARLLNDARFQERYVRIRPPDPIDPWPQQLAARVGAERIFEHAFPGQHYLLAAFVRQSRSEASPSGDPPPSSGVSANSLSLRSAPSLTGPSGATARYSVSSRRSASRSPKTPARNARAKATSVSSGRRAASRSSSPSARSIDAREGSAPIAAANVRIARSTLPAATCATAAA